MKANQARLDHVKAVLDRRDQQGQTVIAEWVKGLSANQRDALRKALEHDESDALAYLSDQELDQVLIASMDDQTLWHLLHVAARYALPEHAASVNPPESARSAPEWRALADLRAWLVNARHIIR